MSSIDISVDNTLELSTYVVKGKISFEEIFDALLEFYSHPTKYLIWDIREADISNASNDDLRKLVKTTKEVARVRPSGKTAILGQTDLQFGLARMYATYGELEDHPVQISVFRSLEPAMKWITSA